MSASIVQSDNLSVSGNNPVSFTFFESFYGMPNVQAGHALVVFIGGGNGGSCTVSSISDNYGNTYEQIPGAYISANGQWQDVWWAQNINPVTDPPTQLHITAELSKTDSSNCGIVVVECSGINGATLVAGTASSIPDPNAPVDGPSLNGGSGALYLASVCSTYASAGDFDNSNRAAINSPWAFPAQSGPGTGGSGFSWSGPQGPCVVGLVASGVQQPIFDTTQVDTPGSEAVDFIVISAVAFIAAANPLAITTTSLPNAQIGVPYSQTLQATGGTPPYSWLEISGSLPPGLSVASDGVISGTPTEGGNFSFTVGVSDSSSPVGAVMATLGIDVVAGSGGGWGIYSQVVKQQQRPQPAPPRPFYNPKR